MGRGNFPEWVKKKARKRASGRCEYCQMLDASYLALNFEYDHAIPRVAGGNNSLNNCVFACAHCNAFKGIRIQAKDPQSNEDVPLFNPRQMLWQEHFAWSDDKLEMQPLTPTGRATVAALRLNREAMKQHRRSEQIIEEKLAELVEKPPSRER